MRTPALAILLAGLVVSCDQFYNWREIRRTYQGFTSDGTQVSIAISLLPEAYINLRHLGQITVRAGRTKISIKYGEKRNLNLDLPLELEEVTADRWNNKFYLTFENHSNPSEGFSCYIEEKPGDFTEAPLSSVPPNIAFPNLGNRSLILREFAKKNPVQLPTGSKSSYLGKLFGQFITDKPWISGKSDSEIINEHWKKWSAAYATGPVLSKIVE